MSMERSLRAEPLLDRLEAGEPFKLLGGVPPSESAESDSVKLLGGSDSRRRDMGFIRGGAGGSIDPLEASIGDDE